MHLLPAAHNRVGNLQVKLSPFHSSCVFLCFFPDWQKLRVSVPFYCEQFQLSQVAECVPLKAVTPTNGDCPNRHPQMSFGKSSPDFAKGGLSSLVTKGQNRKKQNPLIIHRTRFVNLRPCEAASRGLGKIGIPQAFGTFVAQKYIAVTLRDNCELVFHRYYLF